MNNQKLINAGTDCTGDSKVAAARAVKFTAGKASRDAVNAS